MLFEDEEGRLHFADLDLSGVATLRFVFALVTVIASINGLVQVWMAIAGAVSFVVPLVLWVLAVAFAGLWYLVSRTAKRKRERPVEELRILLVLDRVRGVVADATGHVLAPLDALRFRRAFQPTSSSRRLVAEWPGGQRTLVRGNPFAGGLSDVAYELERLGFRV